MKLDRIRTKQILKKPMSEEHGTETNEPKIRAREFTCKH